MSSRPFGFGTLMMGDLVKLLSGCILELAAMQDNGLHNCSNLLAVRQFVSGMAFE